jgi:hypothetical protein
MSGHQPLVLSLLVTCALSQHAPALLRRQRTRRRRPAKRSLPLATRSRPFSAERRAELAHVSDASGADRHRADRDYAQSGPVVFTVKLKVRKLVRLGTNVSGTVSPTYSV